MVGKHRMTPLQMVRRRMAWKLLLSFSLLAYTATADARHATRCFECTDLPLPHYCGHVTECSPSMMCVVEEIITSSGLTLYNSGCMSKERCSLTRKDGIVSRGSDAIICEECCDGELCNNQGCGFIGIKISERGPMCFHCSYEHDPHSCRTVVQCKAGQVCMVTELSRKRPDGGSLYSSSCTAPENCQPSNNFIIGKKRDMACHTCCTEDFCNDKCQSPQGTPMTSSTAMLTSSVTAFSKTFTTQPIPKTATTVKNDTTSGQTMTSQTTTFKSPLQTTTPMTSQTTRPSLSHVCDQHGYIYDEESQLCYRFHESQARSWSDADHRCKNEGARLAVIDTPAKWAVVKDKVIRNYHHNVYIGAHDHGHDHYYWTNGARLKFENWKGNQPDGGSHEDCVYVDHDDHRSWHDTECDNNYAYICTIYS